MIVLKDIKVSKLRIPVQNSLWLRPIDKETYKLYYPSGGNWKEVIIETSEDMSNIEERVKALEEALAKVNVDISEIKAQINGLDAQMQRQALSDAARFSAIDLRISGLEDSIEMVMDYLEAQLATIAIDDSFDAAAEDGGQYYTEAMTAFGFSPMVIDSIFKGYCTKATVLEQEYNVTKTGTANNGRIVLHRQTPFEETSYYVTIVDVTTLPADTHKYILSKEHHQSVIGDLIGRKTNPVKLLYKRPGDALEEGITVYNEQSVSPLHKAEDGIYTSMVSGYVSFEVVNHKIATIELDAQEEEPEIEEPAVPAEPDPETVENDPDNE